MKRFYALLLSVIMIVTLSLSALATSSPGQTAKPSPTPAPAPAATTQATPPAPASPTATASASVVAQLAALADVSATVASSDFINAINGYLENNETFKAIGNIPDEAKLALAFDLKFDGEIPAGGLKVTIPVVNATPGDYVIVMHRKANGDWEVVGRGFLNADGTIEATFTSFSPVVVLVVDAADVTAAGIKAPKTGE